MLDQNLIEIRQFAFGLIRLGWPYMMNSSRQCKLLVSFSIIFLLALGNGCGAADQMPSTLATHDGDTKGIKESWSGFSYYDKSAKKWCFWPRSIFHLLFCDYYLSKKWFSRPWNFRSSMIFFTNSGCLPVINIKIYDISFSGL